MPALTVVAALVAGIATDAGAVLTFRTSGGQVVIEAEQATRKSSAWAFEKSYAGYKGTGYMKTTSAGESRGIEFDIDFHEAGTYCVHLRTWASDIKDNGFHGYIDGRGFTGNGIYVKKNSYWFWYTGLYEAEGMPRFTVTAGKHTFALRKREVDARVDQLWLTKNATESIATFEIVLPDPSAFVVGSTGTAAQNVSGERTCRAQEVPFHVSVGGLRSPHLYIDTGRGRLRLTGATIAEEASPLRVNRR